MSWFLVVSTIIGAWAVWSLSALFQSYRLARSSGLPVRITLSNGNHPIFAIFGIYAGNFFKRFPWPISTFGAWSYYGWSYDDHRAGSIHEKYGPAVFISTSWGNSLVIADPEAALTLNIKWKTFTKPPNQQALALFGPNLDTVEGSDWNKHRRLTAPCFNEKSSSLVWAESRAQALGILKKIITAGNAGVDSVANDTATLALHVLTKVAFGQESSFDAGETIAPGFTLSLQQALKRVMRKLVPCVIFGAKLASPVFPKAWRDAGLGFIEYDRYVQDIVDREKAKLESGNDTSNNLISVLLRATVPDEKSQDGAFTIADVKGNCFIFAVAGHDTTANSLALAIALLSSRPHLQEWLAEEIDAILGDTAEPDYEEHFPRLVRCQAILFETLRLFPAVPELPKHTGNAFVPLTVAGKEHVIPPDTTILMNLFAIHRLKKCWGNDAEEWRPERWIVSSASETPNNTGSISKSATINHKSETIKEPQRGTYMPWAEGPRICPGSRFARVEFVATILTLFRNHKVRPLPLSGESEAQARERTKIWAEDVHGGGVAMNLKRPEDVILVWERR